MILKNIQNILILQYFILTTSFFQAFQADGNGEGGRSSKEFIKEGSNLGLEGVQVQRCYVCVATGAESWRELANLFPDDPKVHTKNITLPDCASFTPATAKAFEFTCPHRSSGCILKIHGNQFMRTCSPFYLNDCKSANSVDYCYCSGQLCNVDRESILERRAQMNRKSSNFTPTLPRLKSASSSSTNSRTKIWSADNTDDEDLLEESQLHFEVGEYGSGDGDSENPTTSQNSGRSDSDSNSNSNPHYPANPAYKNPIVHHNVNNHVDGQNSSAESSKTSTFLNLLLFISLFTIFKL